MKCLQTLSLMPVSLISGELQDIEYSSKQIPTLLNDKQLNAKELFTGLAVCDGYVDSH